LTFESDFLTGWKFESQRENENFYKKKKSAGRTIVISMQ